VFAEEFSKARPCSERPIEQVKKVIQEFLGDGYEKGRQEIDVFVSSKTKACKATVSNALKELVEDGKIWSPRFGYYKKK
jgi:DNA replicative helicase MCM subunit Mcm2 (Cdc46/Mcm family)